MTTQNLIANLERTALRLEDLADELRAYASRIDSEPSGGYTELPYVLPLKTPPRAIPGLTTPIPDGL